MVRGLVCGVVLAVTLLGVTAGSSAPPTASPGTARSVGQITANPSVGPAPKPGVTVGPGPLSQRDIDAQVAQQPYFALADKVDAINRAQAHRGLGGLLLDQPGHAVKVYWVGTIPAALRALQIAQRDRKVRLRILPARSTEGELSHAGTWLGDLNERDHLGISVIDFPSDGSALTVRAPGLGKAANGQVRPTRKQAALIAAARRVERSTGVVIRLADAGPADRAVPTGGALTGAPSGLGAVGRTNPV